MLIPALVQQIFRGGVPTACRPGTEPGGQIIEGLPVVQTIEKGSQLFVGLDDDNPPGGEILFPD
ncbi:hypothetical protein BWR60_02565 [Inquilinus limosus]|uniref:Uncharacterized protein n=1 Tax=Inquilinus limosus TaxID=171674 RepID=A0A211ZTQ6_9PROT|nr:hypothetical protein BWR60_02565 [Inquilinus limosus]